MRPTLLAVLLLLSLHSLTAQQTAPEYIDVVSLRGGDLIEGTVIEYVHNKRVVVVLNDGSLKEIAGEDVRRVNFRLDKGRLNNIRRNRQRQASTAQPEEVAEITTFRPTRSFFHQVTGAINTGRTTNSRFGGISTTIGGSFAYHLVKEVKFLKVGGGVDISLMSDARNENVLAATAFAESAFSINGGRVRPLVRFEAGPSIPFGSAASDNEIIDRNLSFLLHPSVGLELMPPNGGWGILTFDIGYRFLDSKFTVITPNLDELERVVNYRRLVIRGGLRF